MGGGFLRRRKVFSLVVRVKLRVKSKRSKSILELVVLANGGAESPRPCIVLRPEEARRLGLWPIDKAEIYLVEEASSTSEAYLIPGSVILELIDEEGKVLSSVNADLVVQEGLSEPLITDITIDELGIRVISFSKGLWRFKDDPEGIVRMSAKR